MSKNDRSVFKTPNGWANKRDDAGKASTLHNTQQEAVEAAHRMLVNQGGGELKVMGQDGRIRSKDTIAHPDPLPPRDKEH